MASRLWLDLQNGVHSEVPWPSDVTWTSSIHWPGLSRARAIKLSATGEYTTYVRHVDWRDNQIADALSRITTDAVELAHGADYHAKALAICTSSISDPGGPMVQW